MLKITEMHIECACNSMEKNTVVLSILNPIFIGNSIAMATKMPALLEIFIRLKRMQVKALQTDEYKALASAILPIYFANGERLPPIKSGIFWELPRMIKSWDEPEKCILWQIRSFGQIYADFFEEMKKLIDSGFYYDLLVLVHVLLRRIELDEQKESNVRRFHCARSYY